MLTALSFVLATSFQAPSLNMKLLPSGAFDRMKGYAPIGIKLSDAKPDELKNAPVLSSPKYGSVKFGGKTFLFVLDGTKLYVDSNGDGDLTDDPPTIWAEKTFKSYGLEKKEWDGFATIELPYEGKDVPCRIGVYGGVTPGQLGCYVDFALAGTVTLGGKTHQALLSDTTGDFDVLDKTPGSSILVIDLENNGQFNPGYEFFRINEPFNIGGTTFELKGKGSGLSVVKSAKSVPERLKANAAPPDPNLANGLKQGVPALSFTATTMDGSKLSFPKTYAHKLVMIDFWATWCGPCMREVPNLAKVYARYHARGFEVLGVSLDQANSSGDVKTVATKNGMSWPQIYDGKYWQSAIATLYQIKAIPASYLVDGDTGKVLATSSSLRGEQLEHTIDAALKAKSK